MLNLLLFLIILLSSHNTFTAEQDSPCPGLSPQDLSCIFSLSGQLRTVGLVDLAKKHDDLIARMIEDGRLERLLQSTIPAMQAVSGSKKRKRGRRPLHYTVSIEEGREILACNDCYEIFTNKSSLSRHWHPAHNPDFQPYPCDKCGKLFRKKTNMQRHQKKVNCQMSEVDSDDFSIE